MKAIIYHGDRKQRNEIRLNYMPKTIGPNFPIIITSYEVAMNDTRRYLRHYKWKYVVVDEVNISMVQQRRLTIVISSFCLVSLLFKCWTSILFFVGSSPEKCKLQIAERAEAFTH